MVVPRVGSVQATEDPFEPYQLLDPDGRIVLSVAAFLRELQACGRPESTQRSYAMALLRWVRFLWALGVAWDQATRVEGRDFARWVQVATKPNSPHWRRRGEPPVATGPTPARREPSPNPVTGKAGPGVRYAAVAAA